MITVDYCIQDTISSRARSAFRPSARASKGILHTMLIKEREGGKKCQKLIT